MDLVEVDCVDREATSAIFDFLPDRIGTFLTSYGLEVALHSIHAHGNAINERERLRVLREHRGKFPRERHVPTQQEPSCGLAVVLPVGRRIEVHPDFDTSTFERLVGILGGRKPCLDSAQPHGSIWLRESLTCAIMRRP